MPELLASEKGLPVVEARQHAIVLLTRRPQKHWTYLVLGLTALMLVWPHSWFLPWLVVVLLLGLMRYRLWRAERIVLTSRRIIHVYGVLETTREEAWLRLDRISGLRLKETAFGRLLGYATVHVEAPGEHPGLKRLFRIDRGHAFYRRLRAVVLEGLQRPDPDEAPPQPDVPAGPSDFVTERLPVIEAPHPPPRQRPPDPPEPPEPPRPPRMT